MPMDKYDQCVGCISTAIELAVLSLMVIDLMRKAYVLRPQLARLRNS